MFSELVLYLPRIIKGFPVILRTQEDIFKAEQSGDLSYGLLIGPGQPQLPGKIRYILSLLYEHKHVAEQRLFFNFKEETSYPVSAERQAARKETRQKLITALQQLKLMGNQSNLLRYMDSIDDNKNTTELELAARIELISLVVSQWDEKVRINEEYINCLIHFERGRKSIMSLLFPNKVEDERAKKYMELQANEDVDIYHHAWGMGITIWQAIKKLRAEIRKPKFIKMLENGEWSPAAFLVQHHVPIPVEFRLAMRPTNLGGVLSYQINAGRLVILSSVAAAKDAKGLFLDVCCASNFIMDLLTLLVDHVHPGCKNPW